MTMSVKLTDGTPKPTTSKYRSAKNNYRCKSLTSSKTTSVSKQITELFLQDLLIPKNNNVRMKLQTLQMIQIFIECKIMVGGASVQISKLSLFRLKIAVGCSPCTCPSIRVCGVYAMCVLVCVVVVCDMCGVYASCRVLCRVSCRACVVRGCACVLRVCVGWAFCVLMLWCA